MGHIKTDNAGQTWVKSSVPVGNVLFDPKHTDTLYALSHLFPNQEGSLFKSIDGEKNWTNVTPVAPQGRSVRRVIVDPGNPSALWGGEFMGGMFRKRGCGRRPGLQSTPG